MQALPARGVSLSVEHGRARHPASRERPEVFSDTLQVFSYAKTAHVIVGNTIKREVQSVVREFKDLD